MNVKIIRRLTFLLGFLLLIIYVFNASGYSIIEKTAIKNSYPFQDGTVIHEKSYTNKKIVMWKTDHSYYVKLVESKWGIFYHVSNVAELQSMSPSQGKEEGIKRIWSASLNSMNRYETIFGVVSNNPKIKKVIISNDSIDGKVLSNINEIKKNSTVFIELNLENGFAAAYKELAIKDTGEFVFRGVNDQGEIVTFGI